MYGKTIGRIAYHLIVQKCLWISRCPEFNFWMAYRMFGDSPLCILLRILSKIHRQTNSIQISWILWLIRFIRIRLMWRYKFLKTGQDRPTAMWPYRHLPSIIMSNLKVLEPLLYSHIQWCVIKIINALMKFINHEISNV